MGRLLDFTTRKAIGCNCDAMTEQDCPEHGSHSVTLPPPPDTIAVVPAVTGSLVPHWTLGEPRPDKELVDALETAKAVSIAPLTAQELHKKLYEKSATDIGGLISFYKQTGNWNPLTERLMGRVVEDIKAICGALAGVK